MRIPGLKVAVGFDDAGGPIGITVNPRPFSVRSQPGLPFANQSDSPRRNVGQVVLRSLVNNLKVVCSGQGRVRLWGRVCFQWGRQVKPHRIKLQRKLALIFVGVPAQRRGERSYFHSGLFAGSAAPLRSHRCGGGITGVPVQPARQNNATRQAPALRAKSMNTVWVTSWARWTSPLRARRTAE